jgi:DNA polymerase III epsilon subunit family exonuclease
MNFISMVAFDVETTGLDAEIEEIVELGAVKFSFVNENGRLWPIEIGSFSQLVNPGRPIPPVVSAINHIYDDMVKDAPPVQDALPGFLRFCGATPYMVAHKAAFDTEFIGRALKRVGLAPNKTPILDSLKIIKKTNFEFRSFKLGEIAKKLSGEIRFKPEAGSLHRADYDCRVLAHVLTTCLRKRFPIEEFSMEKSGNAFKKLHGKPLYFSDFI